jgi:hypothetical protein
VYVVCMRYGGGVFARFEMSHFTEDATGDALAWSALNQKVGSSEPCAVGRSLQYQSM